MSFSGSWGGFGNLAEPFAGSRLRDRRYDDSPQLFESHLSRILVSFLASGESSFGDLYFEAHRVGPAGVRDDELVLPVLRRRDLNRTLRSGQVVLSDFRAGGVVNKEVHVGIFQAVRGGLVAPKHKSV